MATKSKKANNTTRVQRITKLDELELTGSASRNLLINSVKQMFERGVIQRVDVAEPLIKLTQETKMDEFDAKFAKIEKHKTQKKQRNKHKRSQKTRATT